MCVARAEPLTLHHGPHTDSHSELSLSLVTLSSHSETHSQRTDRRRPEAAHDPGGHDVVPHADGGKNASWIAATEHRGGEIGDDARDRR